MHGTFFERSTNFDNKILCDLHTLLNTMTFHDLPYTTKQFITNLTDITLTTWLLWSEKFRASLLKEPNPIQLTLLHGRQRQPWNKTLIFAPRQPTPHRRALRPLCYKNGISANVLCARHDHQVQFRSGATHIPLYTEMNSLSADRVRPYDDLNDNTHYTIYAKKICYTKLRVIRCAWDVICAIPDRVIRARGMRYASSLPRGIRNVSVTTTYQTIPPTWTLVTVVTGTIETE